MKLITWNINSVRKRVDLLLRLVAEQQPDIVCLQEIKGENMVFPAKALRGAGYEYQAICGLKAYNGVAILAREPFTTLEEKNWCGKKDARHVAVRLASGVELHNFYVPAGGDVPDVTLNEKFAHKLAFMDEMVAWSASCRAPKILVGDLNIAPLPDDVWSHKELLNVISHTPIEVEKMEKFQAQQDWVDALRELVPAPHKLYSWWSYRAQDWATSNRGRRLDHIWLTPDLKKNLKAGGVLQEVRGWPEPSDHAPVWIDIAL